MPCFLGRGNLRFRDYAINGTPIRKFGNVEFDLLDISFRILWLCTCVRICSFFFSRNLVCVCVTVCVVSLVVVCIIANRRRNTYIIEQSFSERKAREGEGSAFDRHTSSSIGVCLRGRRRRLHQESPLSIFTFYLNFLSFSFPKYLVPVFGRPVAMRQTYLGT